MLALTRHKITSSTVVFASDDLSTTAVGEAIRPEVGETLTYMTAKRGKISIYSLSVYLTGGQIQLPLKESCGSLTASFSRLVQFWRNYSDAILPLSLTVKQFMNLE